MAFIEGIMQYDFLQKALLTSVMVGIICGAQQGTMGSLF